MNKKELYILMQLNGGTFPTGGFSQSWGLETYVSEGTVSNSETFAEFLETYLDAAVGKCEGPVLLEAYRMTEVEDFNGLKELEALSNASKVTKESRQAGIRMGKAFLRLMQPIINCDKLDEIADLFRGGEVSYPVIYGAVCCILNMDSEEALRAYVYSAANTLVQSGIKLIPLGNTEAQQILFNSADLMESAVELSMKTAVEDITNFCPGMDIASIKHEILPVRLYMS